MAARTYSRLVVPRGAGDEVAAGIVWRFSPLGCVEEGANLVACFRDRADAHRAEKALFGSRISSEVVADLVEEDPMAVFRAASRPFLVGRRFWVDPGDPSDAPAPEGKIALRVPASMAFGTGGHESTRLALEALEDLPVGGSNLLDVGTGSGILALAAAGLGASRVVGLDTDDEAVFVAGANRARHPFGPSISLVAGPIGSLFASFGIVVANMLPAELLEVLVPMKARVEPAGRLLLSGIPLDDERPMTRHFEPAHWDLSERRVEGEWVCLILDRVS